MPAPPATAPVPRLGLRANWPQFTLLVLVNAFVGGMVGLERTILPRLAEQEFHLVARSAILSFIVVFGLTKAAANYYAGAGANRVGRKNLLVLGWLCGLPVPLLLLWAPSWGWVMAANVLLGLNQGLAWSSTVVMKIDLVGPRQRGLAMGLNESAGYLAVDVTAFASGWLATEYGLRPYPFYLGLALAVLGLLSSLLVRDTRAHVALEAAQTPAGPTGPPLSFGDVSWRHPNLGSVTQAGLVNNLNDGMVWGLLPLLLAGKGFSLTQIGAVAAVYPAVWGLGQLVTGPLADRFCKKTLLFWGMLVQGVVLLAMLLASSYPEFLGLAGLLGAGTALVYPTFLAAMAEYAPFPQRAHSLGIFRLWRDAGYAVGALLTGVLADAAGLSVALGAIGGLTLGSAALLQYRMRCAAALPSPGPPQRSRGLAAWCRFRRLVAVLHCSFWCLSPAPAMNTVFLPAHLRPHYGAELPAARAATARHGREILGQLPRIVFDFLFLGSLIGHVPIGNSTSPPTPGTASTPGRTPSLTIRSALWPTWALSSLRSGQRSG